ncbi:Ldh family oxidoreductase [Nocardioides luteus]|uniref:Ldh family oxidoreductase n=1 Tax=Nocardioides luteus TaxID=1844 RepID=UPI0018CAEF2D|nr:Ldh family oxidoreductase [Nocardioides luteus]MBG6099061.1 LDH2 family malate/lactate/ureidoglycolate dehydrogenase [Nocardioides luteus]
MTVQLTVAEVGDLIRAVLISVGLTHDDAVTASEHILDCELRGLSYGGLPRTLSVAERLLASGVSPGWRLERETPVSVTLNGADQLGYIVAQRATEFAIEKASISGMCVAAAHDTWYTGMFSWYLEQVTAAGFVGVAAGNGGAFVAPHGATEPLLGTNPIAFGFPSLGDPVIWDSGTSSLTHAEVVLSGRLGNPLPPGTAFDADGAPTTDPAAALAGAIAVWGGHRGSGLSLAVHLLGMLTSSPAIPRRPIADLGFLLIVVDPEIITDGQAYRAGVSEHADRIRAARPVEPGRPVRVPFDRSRAQRAATLSADRIEVEPAVLAALEAIMESAAAGARP